MSEVKGSWERINALLAFYFDSIADCDEYLADRAMVKEHAAQVAALTAQRDAAVAACKAGWYALDQLEFASDEECEKWEPTYCQLAAAIAMTEDA